MFTGQPTRVNFASDGQGDGVELPRPRLNLPYRLEQLVVGQPIPVPAQQLSDSSVHAHALSNT